MLQLYCNLYSFFYSFVLKYIYVFFKSIERNGFLNMIYYVIGGVLLFIILSMILISIAKKRKIIKLGKDGEKKVAKVLKKLSSSRKYKIINDLYLPLYDKTTQVDHILIGSFGLIVIETKNLSGEVYGDPKKKDWLHIIGKKKHTLYNPLMQNQTHIDCIRHILGKENLYSVTIDSLIVFSAKKIQLFVPNKLPTIRIKKLKNYFKKSEYSKNNNINSQKIYDALIKYQVTNKKLIANHNRNVKIMTKNNK